VCVKLCEEGGARLYRSYGNPHLFRNHPNPFNATTILEYFLPSPSAVRIDVYDMRGRMVACMIPGDQSAGSHGLAFSSEALPSGVYAAVLRASNTVRVQYLTVLK
jgi:hypothetical protein